VPLPSYDAVRAAVDEVGRAGTYRLLLSLLASARGVDLPAALDHPALADRDTWALLTDLATAVAPGSATPTDDLLALGELHQRLLASDDRRSAGAWFTPWPLVEHLLDLALEPLLPSGEVRVLDPACGAGVFLAAAARRVLARADPDVDAVGLVRRSVHGTDLDPDAVELARVVLWLELLPHLDPTAPLPELGVAAGDTLGDAAPAPSSYDVVVGNPPFLNQLERATALERAAAERVRREDPGLLGPYTDLSAVFLVRAASWVRPGGRVALVQPVSLLAARDAAGVRARLAETCVVEALWTSDGRAFDAAVNTCAPVLRRRTTEEEQGGVARSGGVPAQPLAAVPAGDLRGSWGHLVAAGLGVPALVWRTAGVLGDLARCTADFRDQYYGLAGAVEEADADGGPSAGRVPLVTSGLLEPGRCDWGCRPTRFLKQAWRSPVVVLDRLDDDLAAWARARLVPKVLVGTQGRVVEAVADPDGAWLPSVPVISVVPRDGRLWHVLAVLLAPPVSVHAATTYAGAALSPTALKLSARQVAALPLPVDRGAWDEAALLLSRGQESNLQEAATLMCTAYDVPAGPVLDWWRERVLRSPGRPRSARRTNGPATGR
jgi:SAM-dependent methyltransferase